MPIYEYRCERGHSFEVLQRMADEPVSVCTDCDAKVERVLHPVAVHFKGSGFYTTDYGKKGRGGVGESGESKNGSGGDDKAANKDSGSTAGTASKSAESSKTGSSSSSSSSSD